jgi:hypothetical protein
MIESFTCAYCNTVTHFSDDDWFIPGDVIQCNRCGGYWLVTYIIANMLVTMSVAKLS